MLDATACTIRAMEGKDLTSVLTWRNHPDVRRHMITQHEISLEEHEAWFARASQDGNRSLLIVEQGREPIGFMNFDQAIPGAVSNWGFYVVPGAPKGTGRKLAKAALQYAFEEIRVHKVCGQALALNEASIRFHVALGFKMEGVLRSQQRIGNQYHDLVCFGLLGSEWVSTTTT